MTDTGKNILINKRPATQNRMKTFFFLNRLRCRRVRAMALAVGACVAAAGGDFLQFHFTSGRGIA